MRSGSRRARSRVSLGRGDGEPLALLAATRSFELVAVVLAWGIVAVGPAARAPRRPRGEREARQWLDVGGVRGDDGVVYLATGKRELSSSTRTISTASPGRCPTRRSPRRPTLSFASDPGEARPALVDPCYLSLCSIPTTRRAAAAGRTSTSGASRSRSSSRAADAPALHRRRRSARRALAARRRATGSRRRCGLRPLAEMTVAATGLVARLRGEHAHRAEPPALRLRARLPAAGAPHGDRGRARWRRSRSGALLSRREASARDRRPRSRSWSLAFVLVGRSRRDVRRSRASTGLPRIEGRHLAPSSTSARCAGQTCDVRVAGGRPSGRRRSRSRIVDPDLRLRERPRRGFTIYVERARRRRCRSVELCRDRGSSLPGRPSWGCRPAASSSPQSAFGTL